MKQFAYYFIVCCFFSLFLFSCNNDDLELPLPDSYEDSYSGSYYTVMLQDEMDDFHHHEFICTMMAEDGTIVSRRGEHMRFNKKSTLQFKNGLKEGTYRLLYLEAPVVGQGNDTTWVEYGLGCRVLFSADTAKILDVYSKLMRLSGSGTAKDPFIISSADHFKRLREITNDNLNNNLLLDSTHFKQTADINMEQASWSADADYGWISIGNIPNNPFRGIYDGNNYAIRNLEITRTSSAGIALFGYAASAVFKNIKLENPRIEGNYGVGALLGATTSTGERRDKVILLNCSTEGGYVKGSNSSAGIGGLVGVVDMNGMCMFDGCNNNGTSVMGDYAAGGLLGGGTIYSQVTINQSNNSGAVTANYTGAGGLAGSVDSLAVLGCSNSGRIEGGKLCTSSDMSNGGYGTGGIVGGTGISYIFASTNSGNITGCAGVGGIIGSTRLGTEETMFNNVLVKSSGNTGNVTGQTAVGGICGEAQFGCYAVYNSGNVTATAADAHLGGIVGNTSISVIHNALNSGKVFSSNVHCAGGIVGKTTWGAIFASQNLGEISVNANYAGGVIGLAGNYTMVNYCYNGGYITNEGGISTGGIVGEIGDPREWAPIDIASCIIGSIECITAIVGPVISLAGNAMSAALTKAGETASTLTKVMGKLGTVLHVGEAAFEYLLVANDKLMLYYGIYDLCTIEEIELMESSLDKKVSEVDSAIREKMAQLRSEHTLASDLLLGSLSGNTASLYNQNINKLLTYYEASSDNTNTINYNINNKREERCDELEERKIIKSSIQKVIAGACILTTIVAAVVGTIATGGVATAFIVTGSVATIIGGTNAIVEGSTNYQNNVVIVSQCVNMGKMKADNSENIGGIIGTLEQNGCLFDCLNASAYTGTSTKTGSLVGHSASRAEIKRCLSTGRGWEKTASYSTGDFVSTHYVYFYNESFTGFHYYTYALNIDRLCDPSSYINWDINKENSIWSVEESKGYFPIPFCSEMQEEVTEEE